MRSGLRQQRLVERCALFVAGFAKEPITRRPERTGQAEITPKSKPGAVPVEAVRQPFDAGIVFETNGPWIVTRGGVDRADETITKQANRQQRQCSTKPFRLEHSTPEATKRCR